MRVREPRTGSVLVEFALVMFILILLLAAIFDFGRATYTAQVTQSAADRIARELSQTPLPADMTRIQLQRALNGEDPSPQDDAAAFIAVQAVYSKNFLVLDVTGQPPDKTLLEYLDSLSIPLGNRLLVPLMVLESHDSNPLVPVGSRWLRHPGGMVEKQGTTGSTPYAVAIPTYVAGNEDGPLKGDADWPDVVEIAPDNASTAFSLIDAAPGQPAMLRGIVSLVVNFPFQAAGPPKAYMPGGLFGPKDPTDPNNRLPRAVAATPVTPGIYAGPEGLGEFVAAGSDLAGNAVIGPEVRVRPYRRVLSSQGIYRREVFR